MASSFNSFGTKVQKLHIALAPSNFRIIAMVTINSPLRHFPRISTKVDYGTERVNHLFPLMASFWSGFLLFQVFFSSMRSGSSCQIYFMTLNKPGLANWWGKTSHHGDLMGNSQGILSRNTPVSLQSRLPCQHCTIFEMLPW